MQLIPLKWIEFLPLLQKKSISNAEWSAGTKKRENFAKRENEHEEKEENCQWKYYIYLQLTIIDRFSAVWLRLMLDYQISNKYKKCNNNTNNKIELTLLSLQICRVAHFFSKILLRSSFFLLHVPKKSNRRSSFLLLRQESFSN